MLAKIVKDLDHIIYSLIIEYENPAGIQHKDATYIRSIAQRLREGLLILEFLSEKINQKTTNPLNIPKSRYRKRE